MNVTERSTTYFQLLVMVGFIVVVSVVVLLVEHGTEYQSLHTGKFAKVSHPNVH